MRHSSLAALILLPVMVTPPSVAAADLTAVRSQLTTVRVELDAEQPKIKASTDALNANRLSALGAEWASVRLAKIKDGTSNTLLRVPDSAAKAAASSKLAELGRAIDAFAAANRDGAARWGTAYAAIQAASAAVPPLQAKLGDLSTRLGSGAAVPAETEAVTLELQRKLKTIDDGVAVALTTDQGQSAAWQAVFVKGQDLGKLLNAGGNFGDTPGLSGGDMIQQMAEMNMAFLKLQEAVQMESRRFQTLSNASKARHDIALNAIRSIKP